MINYFRTSKDFIFVIIFLLFSFFFIPFTTFAAGEFITTWKTDNAGVSDSDQITIPTADGLTYNYNVDWGDATTDTGLTGDATHTYNTPGTYTVEITGTFPTISFVSDGDKNKILSVEQWGTNTWATLGGSFFGCSNLEINAIDAPDLSLADDLTYAFRGTALTTEDLSGWDVSTITTMIGVFQDTFVQR